MGQESFLTISSSGVYDARRMGVKVAVVGGGSTYTPELVEGFVTRTDRLPVDELVLMDIDPERLAVVGALAERMVRAAGWAGTVRMTDRANEALEGANFVIVQLRVGGNQARLLDETIPLRFGCIGQETTGPGGFAKALRTVPVVLELAERTAEIGAADAWVVDSLGAIPSSYLRYYYRTGEVLEHQRTHRTRAEEVIEIEAGLLELYRDPTLAAKPKLLEERGGAWYSDAAAALVASLHAGSGDEQVVNVLNQGAIPNMPPGDVVELTCRVDRAGAFAQPTDPLAPEMLGLVQHAKAYERLTIEAALTGSRTSALKALVTNPLVGDVDRAGPMLDALLDANRAHLPRFFP